MSPTIEANITAIERLTKLRYAAERVVKDYPLGMGGPAVEHLEDVLDQLFEPSPSPLRSVADRWKDE